MLIFTACDWQIKWKYFVCEGTVNVVFWQCHLCELVLSYRLDFCPPLPHKTYLTYFFKCSYVSQIFLKYWLCLAAVTTGLVAAVLVFTEPVFWVDQHQRDYIDGLVLMVTMQMGSLLQCILQSEAESKARLRTFAESSRCIEVRMLWCALGGPVLQLQVFTVTDRFVRHKASFLTPSYTLPCLHKISTSEKWVLLILGRKKSAALFFCLFFDIEW